MAQLKPRIRLCPTCGCPEACYNDEHANDEITIIPDDVMEAALQVLPRQLAQSTPEPILRTMIEDIHRAMHGRQPLKRRADRDYTDSGLERFKSPNAPTWRKDPSMPVR